MTTTRLAVDARIAAEVPAGRGRYMRELIRHLVPLLGERRMTLYTRRRWDELPDDERVTWRLVPGDDLRWPLAAGRAMRGECDVALATSSYLMCAAAPTPVHTIVWDLAPFHRSLRTPITSRFEWATLPLAVRRCASLLPISAATRDELVQRFPRAEGRTCLARPAVGEAFTARATAHDQQARARHGVHEPYVLATGTLEPRKNLPRLIEAFASLPEQVRGGRRLVLAGAPGWQTEETFAGVAAHAELVQTLGFVPDSELPALYRGADLFCYPSLYEGFGLPVLEAMSCGVAVLTSRSSSMPEVGGDAARYADPYDTADIRREMTDLLTDASLRAQLGRRGLARAREFSWESTARAVLSAMDVGQ